MNKFNQQLLDEAMEKRELTLKTSAYTIMGLGLAGMLFFVYLFLANQQGREVEAYLMGFIFTSLVFAFGVSCSNQTTFQSSTRKLTKNNFKK